MCAKPRAAKRCAWRSRSILLSGSESRFGEGAHGVLLSQLRKADSGIGGVLPGLRSPSAHTGIRIQRRPEICSTHRSFRLGDCRWVPGAVRHPGGSGAACLRLRHSWLARYFPKSQEDWQAPSDFRHRHGRSRKRVAGLPDTQTIRPLAADTRRGTQRYLGLGNQHKDHAQMLTRAGDD
jgi:hypothetical protein